MKTLISTASEPLTKEQLESRTVAEEDVDVGGVVKRKRVVDQTIWDVMFLHEMIDQPQHEALNLFMDDLVKSGAFPSGARLDREPGDSNRSPSDVHAERRIAFSSAFRAMTRSASDESANAVVKMFSSEALYRKKKAGADDMKIFRGFARFVDDALWALAKHYKTMGRRDPRRILRKQVGAREERWKNSGSEFQHSKVKKKRSRR